ncbi:MAG TPA: CHAD domain-containing protein [Acidimicrobiales bacterium]|nr:CHAD domain-containing protein [Acidimicrobiales bacterium]
MSANAVEREVKLGAWPGFQLPELDEVVPGARVELLPALRLAATYYDTPDLRLARWGATLRHRASSPATDEQPWTLKLPASPVPGALARRELGFPGHESRVPAELVALVRGLSRGAPLVPVARLRTDRRRWELRDVLGARLLEIDDDEVSVLVSGAGGRGRRLAARFRELEVELADGTLDVLAAVVAKLRAAGAGEPDPTPKVVRALGPRAVEPPDVVAAPIGRRSTAGDVVRACIASSVARLFRHDPGVRLGGDIEDVHQARVATRRLRSDLRTFGPLVDAAWARGLRDELGWLADLLGAVRDADVLYERLHAQSRGLPKVDADAADELLARLVRQQVEATAALHAAMGGHRYVSLLDRLVDAAREPRFAADAPEDATLEREEVPVPAPEEAVAEAREPLVVVSATATSTSFTVPGPYAPLGIGDAPGAEPQPGPNGAAGEQADGGEHTDGAEHAPGGEHAHGGEHAPGTPSDAAERAAGPAAPAPTAPAPVRRGPADDPAADVLPALVRRPWRRLARTMNALGASPEDEALHAARIDAKRCRYALEAVAPALGKEASSLAGAVADVQGVLGDLHDAVVAEAWLREAAAGAPTAQALAAGELIAVQRADAEACRRAWGQAWDKASRRRGRGWLKP